MNEIKNYKGNVFENNKHIDENGNEYWLARELMPLLEYTKWENFENVINKAIVSFRNSTDDDSFWLPEVRKPIKTGKGKEELIKDYKLSRYICYLIVQNADPKKKMVALGQTYFAVQTRKQELLEREYSSLSEDEKRFFQRELTKKGNQSLQIAARNAGVRNFPKFHNSGYKGLYNGETANDIAKRKGLRYREDILDNMGSEELSANLFRITQTEAALIEDNIKGESNANNTHYIIGKNIRKTIKKNKRTMPENLPTPNKSLKELELEHKSINKSLIE